MNSRFYNDYKLEGKYIDLSHGKYRIDELNDIFNVLSLSVAPYTKVSLYANNNFEGPKYTISNPKNKRMNVMSFYEQFVFPINSIVIEAIIQKEISPNHYYKITADYYNKNDDDKIYYVHYKLMCNEYENICGKNTDCNKNKCLNGNKQYLIVIIPDIGTNSRIYKPIQDTLIDNKLSSLIIDIRGTGLTKINHNVDPAEIIQDYRSVIGYVTRTFHEPPKIILLGHGLGGLIAQLWALTYKNEINKLILINSAPYGIYNDYNSLHHINKEFTDSKISLKKYSEIVSGQSFNNNTHMPNKLLKKELEKSIDESNCHALKQLLENTKNKDKLAIVSRYIIAPTLIIQGIHDNIISKMAGDDLYFLINNSVYVKLNSDHSPQFTSPQRTFEEIFKFIH